MISLNEVLAYKNQHVLKRYQNDYSHNRLPADKAFTELLKFLWLSQKHKFDKKNNLNDKSLDFDCVIHSEMKEIDDMWHTFLLFTQEYSIFCNNYFSEFIHHEPSIDDASLNLEKYKIELTRYLSYVYDHLGEETLTTWFSEHLEEV